MEGEHEKVIAQSTITFTCMPPTFSIFRARAAQGMRDLFLFPIRKSQLIEGSFDSPRFTPRRLWCIAPSTEHFTRDAEATDRHSLLSKGRKLDKRLL
jgi:hypothetical protein